jgi:hypothetical protein
VLFSLAWSRVSIVGQAKFAPETACRRLCTIGTRVLPVTLNEKVLAFVDFARIAPTLVGMGQRRVGAAGSFLTCAARDHRKYGIYQRKG